MLQDALQASLLLLLSLIIIPHWSWLIGLENQATNYGTDLESHTEQYTLREVQTEVLSDQRPALLWYLTDFPINNVQCYVSLR